MTPIGKTIFSAYSLIIILALIILGFKKLEKEGKGGWEAAALIPILLFIINQI